MPITLIAHYESQDPANAFVNIAALDDPLGSDDADDLIVPDFNRLVAVAFGVPSGGGQRLRLDSPSIRVMGRWEADEFNGGADADAEPDSPQKVVDLRDNPLIFTPTERVIAEVNADTTVAEAAWVLYWFSDQERIEPVSGRQIRTVRVTTTVTLTLGAWTNTGLTFADTLPVGRYGIVGARFQSAGLVAARFVSPDFGYRPGVLCVDDENDQQHPMFRKGGLGVLMEFESVRVPTVDFIAISADANPAGVLDLVQLRAGPR